MKLLHTSDWHLGAKLHERDRSEDHRKFLAFLRGVVEAERPDAMIVAGDVFDVRQPSPAAQRLYYDFIAATAHAGLCPCIVVTAGNHDSAQMLAAADQVLRRLGVHVIAKASQNPADEVIALDGLAVAAVPFMNDAELANFGAAADDARVAKTLGFRSHYAAVMAEARVQSKGAPVVAVGHCTVSGSRISDSRSERGRQVGGLDERDASVFAGADYIALGHLHIPQKVGGAENIRYCGSPLPMSFAEAGQRKFVNIVEFGERAGEPINVREIPVPEFTPLRRLEGSQQRIREELEKLIADSASPVFVALKVAEGEGEMPAFVNSVRTLAHGTNVEILPIEDVRERCASSSETTRRTATLDSLTPLDVALLRLADEHLAPDELDTYSAMLRDVMEGE